VFAFTIATFLVTIKSQNYVAKIATKHYSSSTTNILYDFFHSRYYTLFNVYVSPSHQVFLCKFLDLSFFIYLATFTFISIFYATIEPLSLIQHGLIFSSILFLFRCITYNLTVLPQCDFREKKHNPNENATSTLMNYLLLRKLEFGYSNDLLFSGHVSLVLSATLFIHCFTTVSPIVKFIMWLFVGVISMLLIVMRKHYSIDVLFAYIVTGFFFQNYKTMI
jgi:hypothetical protein